MPWFSLASPGCLPYLLIALLVALPAAAQQAPADGAAGAGPDRSVFAPLDLMDPNAYRTGSGKPGAAYWQQRADYRIRVTLDTTTHRVTGTETITYTNNAPQALDRLWLQLDQNLFAPGSRGARLQGGASRWRGAFPEGGFEITRLEVVGPDGRRKTPAYTIDDTRLRLDLDAPLPPGGASLNVEVDFAFTIPAYGADRMGRYEAAQGTVYEVAQWYPRLYVYDDVSGWNALPYLGQGEFYLEYGTFEVEITVPRGLIVAATGELLNPEEVLTRRQRRRLDRARRSAETVPIIPPSEVGQPATRPRGRDLLTWRYRAEDVRDFAWAASQAFIWDAASWDGLLAMSFYPKEGLGTGERPGWEASTQFVRHSLEHYSTQWVRYPYPVAVNVAGVVGGMEYPMIVFCSVYARGRALFGVTDHEVGHAWFPMLVGSDERRYAWMDEGLTTFINYYSLLDFYEARGERAERVRANYVARRMQRSAAGVPIHTYPDRIPQAALGFLAYRKPAAGLVLLREYVLGPERFDPAFRAYIERWAFKHPQPADFFRTIEDVAGEDLDWFWRGWFYRTDVLDQAIARVTFEDGQDVARVTLANREGLVLPVTVALSYGGRRTERRVIPVEAFFTDDTHTFAVPAAGLATIRLDPEGLLPDVDRGNNIWSRGDAAAGEE